MYLVFLTNIEIKYITTAQTRTEGLKHTFIQFLQEYDNCVIN